MLNGNILGVHSPPPNYTKICSEYGLGGVLYANVLILSTNYEHIPILWW